MAKDDDQPVVTFEDPPAESGGDREPGWHNLADESDVEVVEGDPTAPDPKPPGKSYDDLVAEIQAERAARLAAESKADPVAALQAGILGLKDAIGERTPPVVQQAPGESEDDFSKRMKESFFENPTFHLDKWSQRKLGPVVSQLASMTQATLRAQAMMDPDIGGTYKRYSTEVDKVVASRADKFTNPDVYRECVSLVAGRHISELMAEAAAAALKGQTPTPRPTPAPQYSEPSGRPATRPRVQLKLTAAQLEDARRNGLDPRDYARSVLGKW